MANNNFTVFGSKAESTTIYNTGTESRTSLFTEGLRKKTTAKAEDVLTPLREVSLVTVALLDWIKDVSSNDFSTPGNTDTEVSTFITNVTNGLTAKISKLISGKQDSIGTGTGFLKMENNAWKWDNTSYQAVNAKLTTLIGLNTTGLVFYDTSTNNYKISTNKYMYLDETKSDFANGIIYLIY